MNYPKFLITKRGFFFTCYRLFLILKRFGFTPKKIANNLYAITKIVNQYGSKITFNITAVILGKHPALIQDLHKKGADFGVHGYVHTNYSNLLLNDQLEHFKKAKDIFEENRIPLSGFRAPYLSCNDDTQKAIKEHGFLWSSNQVIDWHVLNRNEFNQTQWNKYQKILQELYKPKSSDQYLSLPSMNSHHVEIPVSIPDDEIMIDRLQLENRDKIEQVWSSLFEQTQKRGELFTLQLHHERFPYYKKALESILQQAGASKSRIWMAALDEIAEWWKEKSGFRFEITHQGEEGYQIHCNCSKRASILTRNLHTNVPQKPFFDGYTVVHDRDFIIESPVKPCIGLSPTTSTRLTHLLKEEGFLTEVNENKDHYGLYLDNHHSFSEKSELDIINLINNSSSPLIRFWRWPDQKHSALSITGDIDCITLWDFVARLFEF